VEAEQTVGLMADSILNLIDESDPNEASSLAPPVETEDHQDLDAKEPPKEEAAPPEPPKEKETRKIKWQGKEIDVTEDELTNLAQQGYDYTKKTQALSDKERQLAPMEGLFKQVQSDPRLAQHIAGYFQGGQPQPAQHQQVIQQVMMEVSRDPEYNEVQGEIKTWLQSLPAPLAKTIYLQLDQDPQSYLETYGKFKADRKARQTTITDPPAPLTKKVDRAPILESSGNSTPSDPAGDAKRKEIARTKKKALQSGDPQALSDWLVGAGVIDNIL
jgi:hypothetical protein